MPEYLSPGVYVEEVDKGTRPIEGVGTAMAAFVGFAPSGVANRPMLITNWTQYVETFGSIDAGGKRNPHLPGSYLSHSVYGYFENGGGRCYVVRVVPPTASGTLNAPPLSIPSRASDAIQSLTFTAKEAPTSDIKIEIAPASGEGAGEDYFTLNISLPGFEPEEYKNVTLGKTPKGASVMEQLKVSKIVMVTEAQSNASLTERAPKLGTYVLSAVVPDHLPEYRPADFVGNAAARSGVEGLEIAADVTMVCAPDLMAVYEAGIAKAKVAESEGKPAAVVEQIKTDARNFVKSVQTKMINHCENMGDRVAIVDPLPGLSPQEVHAWRMKETNYDSKYAALYYPWVTITGADGKNLNVPPCGHMAGVYARSDNERGVHKAPANEVVRGATGIAAEITKGEQDVLNPDGVNCIRAFTGRGIRVWGARTLSSDPAWRYVNVRRLFNFVEKSIEHGTQWVVFEPNDHDLWARVRRDVGAFLTTVWRDGALFGTTAAQAFYVKCDEELNPPESRDLGRLVVEIGLAPVKPAEFVIFRLSQWSGGGA